MLVEVGRTRCIGCYNYTQYYAENPPGSVRRVDCGYCGLRQCTTRPGNRCKHYMERGEVERILIGKKIAPSGGNDT